MTNNNFHFIGVGRVIDLTERVPVGPTGKISARGQNSDRCGC